MPDRKIIAVISIIVIMVFGAAIVTGIIPFKLPRQANLISVSQVNLAQGGQAQGQYLVNTYWDIVYQVNSPQTAILVLNGACSSSNCASTSLKGTFNGATVNATSQLYVTITPGQPTAWVSLSSQSVTWAQSATGLLCQNPFGAFNNCATTAPSPPPLSVLTSGSGAVWHYSFPITVTVQKVGGGDPFTQSKTIDAFSASSVTMNNPNDPSENLTISGLGVNIGSEGLPNPAVTAFQVNGQWTVFGGYDIAGLSSGYDTYWYNGQHEFAQTGGLQNPSSSYNSPGWAQLQENLKTDCVLTYCLVNLNSYYYSPVAPSLTNSQSGSVTSQTYPAASPPGTTGTMTLTNTTNSGLALVPWMQQNYGIFSPYYESIGYGGGMSINSTALQINLPIDVFTPSVQLLASTQLVDTVISQQNNAIFKISSLVSTPSQIYDGQLGTVSMDITDTSSFGGTATISAYQGTTAFGIEPTSQLVALAAGQTKQISFTVKGAGVQTKTNDLLSFQAVNGAGQITDTQSITLTALPVPTGSSLFTIQSICLSSSPCSGISPLLNLTSGTSATVYVTIFDGGLQGTAFVSAQSGGSTIATIAPGSYNQTIGSGATSTLQFSVSGVSTGSTKMFLSVSNGTAVNDVKAFGVSVNNAPPICITNCPTPVSDWLIYLGIGIVGAAAVGLVVYYYKRR